MYRELLDKRQLKSIIGMLRTVKFLKSDALCNVLIKLNDKFKKKIMSIPTYHIFSLY